MAIKDCQRVCNNGEQEGGLTCVGNQYFGIFDAFWAVNSDGLVQDESCASRRQRKSDDKGTTNHTFVKIRICKLSSNFFDDLNVLQIG